MKRARRGIALLIALLMLLGAAGAESWQAAEKDIPRFRTLLALLRASCTGDMDRDAAEAVLEEIRAESDTDYAVARAITDHWYSTVLDADYRMFLWRGEKEALPLERSGLEFGAKHAFVVLGYQLENGQMTWELAGRCDAAAAAARAFPDSILVCTGGATGANNPDGNTEAGLMKDYLVKICRISRRRIFTEPEAMTTLDNAVNVLRILREQGIETMTLVTSDYHQRWAQILFNAVAAVYAASSGYEVRIAGNYNYRVRPDAERTFGCRTGLGQLESLLDRKIETGGDK